MENDTRTARDDDWRWRPEPGAVLGFCKRSARTVLLDLEVAQRRVARVGRAGQGEDAAGEESFRSAIRRAASQEAPPRSFAVPESLHVELTRHCPFHCPACTMERSEASEIPWRTLRSILDEAIRIGVLQIAFGGGEPMLYPRLVDAVDLASAHGLGATVTTSGHGVTGAALRELVAHGLDHLQISIPLEPTARDLKATGAAWSAIAVAGAIGVRFGVNVIVTRAVVPELDSRIAGLCDRGVERVNLLRPKPEPGDGEWFRANRLRGDDWEELARKLARLKATRPDLTVTLDSAMSPVIARATTTLAARPAGGCGAGRRFVAVDVGGRFRPCSHFGRGESGGLLDYWRESAELAALRSLEEEIGAPCADCRELARCRGCRCVAGCSSGDPDCWRAD